MDKREIDHINDQEAYARRNAGVKFYQQDPDHLSSSMAEQQRIQLAQEREAYLARRKARLEQLAEAKLAAHSPNQEVSRRQALPGLFRKD